MEKYLKVETKYAKEYKCLKNPATNLLQIKGLLKINQQYAKNSKVCKNIKGIQKNVKLIIQKKCKT